MACKRKIPQRKCVVTNELKPKKELIRIVRNKQGDVFVDLTGKQNGRGAYVSFEPEVIQQAAEQEVLNNVFNMKVDPAIYEELKQLVSEKENET